MRLTAAALGDAIGGAFVPGLANFVLHLYKAPVGLDPIEYDTKTVEVTLLSNLPTLNSITPAWPYAPLGSGFTSYTAAITNNGATASNVVLQGWISQSTVRRAAGGTSVVCNGGPLGEVPTGTCTASSDIVATNGGSGTGTLVLGPASFEVQLIVDGTIVDTKTTSITLVPTTPSIVSLGLETPSVAIGGSTHFDATVYNPGISTLSSVLVQGYITQGSVEAPAGGIVTTCPTSGALAPGTCNVRFTVNPPFSYGLTAGSAQYVLKLFIGGVLTDTRSVGITLTAP